MVCLSIFTETSLGVELRRELFFFQSKLRFIDDIISKLSKNIPTFKIWKIF